MTLNGSHESLCCTLQTLKFYAEASGLHVNLDKTSLIWFNPMENSSLCNLCGDQGVFENLGITFSVDLSTMVNLNYENKFMEIFDLIIQWKERYRTPYGKITVIKSLALAKPKVQ